MVKKNVCDGCRYCKNGECTHISNILINLYKKRETISYKHKANKATCKYVQSDI